MRRKLCKALTGYSKTYLDECSCYCCAAATDEMKTLLIELVYLSVSKHEFRLKIRNVHRAAFSFICAALEANGQWDACEVVGVLPKWIHCTLSIVGPGRVVIVIFTCVHRNWHFRDEIANTLMKIWMQHIKNTQTNDDYSLFIALRCAALSLCVSNLREMTQSKAHERDDDDIKTNTCTSRWAVNHPHVARLRILRLFWYFALEIYIRHGSSNVNGIFFAFYYRRQFWNNHKWKTPTDRHRARAHTHFPSADSQQVGSSLVQLNNNARLASRYWPSVRALF